MRALLVDDSRTFRFILSNILKRAGFETAEAGNGREALAWLAANPPPDLITIDWNMPEMDGISLVRAIRADESRREIKLVMVTSQTDMNHFTQALSAGANEYIMKPFTEDAVYMKLEILGFRTP